MHYSEVDPGEKAEVMVSRPTALTAGFKILKRKAFGFHQRPRETELRPGNKTDKATEQLLQPLNKSQDHSFYRNKNVQKAIKRSALGALLKPDYMVLCSLFNLYSKTQLYFKDCRLSQLNMFYSRLAGGSV